VRYEEKMNRSLTFTQQAGRSSIHKTVHVIQCEIDFINDKNQDSLSSSVGLGNRELARESLHLKPF